MKFEFTKDPVLIHECVTEPANWRMGSDDAFITIDPALFQVPLDHFFFVRADDLGILIFEPRNCVAMEFHVSLLPHARGRAVEICRAGLSWMFKNTSCQRINSSIPEFNPLAIGLARKIGMQFIGINEKSFLKNGVLHDQHLFGISKEK